MNKPETMLNELKEVLLLKSTLRTSMRGVPHLLVTLNETIYSVCYFGKSRQFKIFYPYPSNNQQRAYCPTSNDVLRFFKSKKDKAEVK